MQTPDDAPAVVSSLPLCTTPLPLPLTWSDLPSALSTDPPASTPAPPSIPATAAAPTSAKSDRSPPAAKGAAPSSSRKGKAPTRRTKWTNDMVDELLRLRFADGDVKRRLETADTKTMKALAWQHFASVLSQSRGVVLTHDQVSLKYRKLKCMFREEKREQRQTGNAVRESEMDAELWAIRDAFEGRVGISGEVLLDSTADDEDEEPSAEKDDGSSKQKAPPVVQLATALQGGMEAIAASLGSRSAADEDLGSLAETLQQQREDTRRFQEMQLQLLKELLTQRKE